MTQIILLSDVVDRITHSRSIGAYVIASQLEEAGYSVLVIDWFTKDPNFLNYLENFLTKDTFMVGISTTFLTKIKEMDGETESRTTVIRRYESNESFWFKEVNELQEWLSSLRVLLDKYNTNCKIALGGRRSDMLYKINNNKRIANIYKEIDYCFVRLSETSILEIVSNNIRSITIENKNGINFVIDPFPKTICPETNYNTKWAIQPGEGLPIEVARGCAFNCKFCYYDKKFSYKKDTKLLKDELTRNYEMFGTTSYVFRDDCFNDSVPKVIDVCNTISSLPFKIRWVSYARVDLAIKFPETLEAMINSGASGLCFGIESFNRDALRRAGKGVHPDKVKEFLVESYAKYKHTCMYHATFVVGLPGETIESLWEGIEWLVKNPCLDSATFGSLDFPSGNLEYDGILRDYPDHVRDPQRYGFEEIKYDPRFWRHDTMDSTTADDMSNQIAHYWKDNNQSTIAIMWFVPRLLSYGITWDDILDIARNKNKLWDWYQKILQLENEWLQNYFNDLKGRNT